MGQSWSGIRKRLEHDLLCEKLRGRVQYFITKYNNAHDESGRFAILVDGEEVIRGNEFLYYQKYLPIECKLKEEENVPRRRWNGKTIEFEEENELVEEKIQALMKECGEVDVYQFTDAIEQYLNQTIQESLVSDNPFVRMFAVLDRRVGQRTLCTLASDVENQPEWLQNFYRLRLQAERFASRSQNK